MKDNLKRLSIHNDPKIQRHVAEEEKKEPEHSSYDDEDFEPMLEVAANN